MSLNQETLESVKIYVDASAPEFSEVLKSWSVKMIILIHKGATRPV